MNTLIKKITFAVTLAIFGSTSISYANDFGLADLKGKILLQPKYSDIRWVSENCFRVTPKGDPKIVVPFFVNQNGETIPTPLGAELYDDDLPLAPPVVPRIKSTQTYPKLKDVKLPGAKMRQDLGFGYYLFEKGGFFGVCDQHGKVIFAPTTNEGSEVRALSTDRFLRETYEAKPRLYKLYDAKARFIADLPTGIFVRSRAYYDDLIIVEMNGGGLYGYVDRDGKYQIKPRFKGAGDFSEGFASVSCLENGTTSGAVINTNGEIVAGPYKDGSIDYFEDGLAIVTLGSRLRGMIDNKGSFIIQPEFEQLYRRGNYIVGLKDKQIYMFNMNGSFLKILPNSISFINPGSNGSWIFSTQGKPTAGHYIEDKSVEQKFGVMTPEGKILLEPKFDYIASYTEGYAVVGSRTPGTGELKTGLLGPEKKFVIPQIYDGVGQYRKNALLFNKSRRFEKYEWFPTRNGRVWRFEPWRKFLKDYNIIGMSRDSVIQLLGPAEQLDGYERQRASTMLTYIMYVELLPHCGNSSSPILEIEFDDKNFVSGWRLHQELSNEPWNRTNMVYAKEKDDWRLVPKVTQTN